jgi:hypothetical protein
MVISTGDSPWSICRQLVPQLYGHIYRRQSPKYLQAVGSTAVWPYLQETVPEASAGSWFHSCKAISTGDSPWSICRQLVPQLYGHIYRRQSLKYLQAVGSTAVWPYLQETFPEVSVGSWFHICVVISTKEYFLISALAWYLMHLEVCMHVQMWDCVAGLWFSKRCLWRVLHSEIKRSGVHWKSALCCHIPDFRSYGACWSRK